MTCEDFKKYDDRLNEFCMMFSHLGGNPGFFYDNIDLLDIDEGDLELLSPMSPGILRYLSWPEADKELREQIRNFRIGTKMKNHAVVDVHSMSEIEFEKHIGDMRYSRYKNCLKKTGGNKKKAAKILDINYKTFQSKLKKYPDLSQSSKDDI